MALVVDVVVLDVVEEQVDVVIEDVVDADAFLVLVVVGRCCSA